jgi:hypothetical protein
VAWQPDAASESFDTGPEHREAIELVGTHLRMTGTIALRRFHRLSDLVNHSLGYVRVHDVLLLRRTGEPTGLSLPELFVNQDEIALIAQPVTAHPATGTGGDASERQTVPKEQRRVIIFTPGHCVTGAIYPFPGADLAGFVDASDPRFVPITDVDTRSLADDRVVGHYAFALLNRTQMLAASEVGGG